MAWLGTWAQRVKVTTDSGDVTANLSDFPVLIHLSANCGKDGQDLTHVFDVLGANGKKIAVTLDDGVTQLYVEEEEWDSVGEEAWLHSKFSSILAASDSDFYLYFDAGQADNNTYVGDPNSATAENVWDANYKLVTHLLDDPDNANIRDSTSNDNDGAKSGAATPTEVAGIISQCQNFVATEFVNHGDPVGDDFDPRAGDFTISFWFRLVAGGHNKPCGKFQDNTHLFDTNIFNGSIYSLGRNPGGVIWNFNTAPDVFNDGNWHYCSLVRDAGNTVKIYVDADTASYSAVTAGGDINPTGSFYLGDRIATGDYDGDLDEFRFSKGIARSASWHVASRESGRDDFLSYGSVEAYVPPTVVTGVFPPQRRRFSEDHLLQIQVRRPVIDLAIISADMRRLVSESMVIDASVRRQIQERLVASGRVYTSRELHELVDDVITLLLLEQVDNIGE